MQTSQPEQLFHNILQLTESAGWIDLFILLLNRGGRELKNHPVYLSYPIVKRGGAGCMSKLHGTKVHGVRARTPAVFLNKKGLAHDLSMYIGHTKFIFTLSKAY